MGSKALVESGAAREERLLFASWHCCLDPSSGAAISMRDLLPLLAGRGWNARAFCGPALDFHRPEALRQVLADQGMEVRERQAVDGPLRYSVLHCRHEGVPVAAKLALQR